MGLSSHWCISARHRQKHLYPKPLSCPILFLHSNSNYLIRKMTYSSVIHCCLLLFIWFSNTKDPGIALKTHLNTEIKLDISIRPQRKALGLA